MNEIKLGDEVYIRNFENQKLVITSFDKEHASCIYLDNNNEFKSIQVKIELLVQKTSIPVTAPKGRLRGNK
jgi:hypothetical protein